MGIVLGEEGELPLTERVLLALPSEKGEGMNEERVGRVESAISVGSDPCARQISRKQFIPLSFVIRDEGSS